MNKLQYIKLSKQDDNSAIHRIAGSSCGIFNGEEKPLYYQHVVSQLAYTSQKLFVLTCGTQVSFPGQSVKNRITPRYIIHYIQSGKGTYNGIRLAKGQGFIVLPKSHHTIIADSDDPWNYSWIAFNGTEADGLMAKMNIGDNNLSFNAPWYKEACSLIKKAIHRDYSKTDTEQYLCGLLYMIISLHGAANNENDSPNCTNSYMLYHQAKTIIDNCYNTDIKISDIASQVHITVQHLERIFKAEHSIPPKEYLLNQKMLYAKNLLISSALTVNEIAGMCGYQEYSLFSRAFKRRFRISPTEFRQKFTVKTEKT